MERGARGRVGPRDDRGCARAARPRPALPRHPARTRSCPLPSLSPSEPARTLRERLLRPTSRGPAAPLARPLHSTAATMHPRGLGRTAPRRRTHAEPSRADNQERSCRASVENHDPLPCAAPPRARNQEQPDHAALPRELGRRAAQGRRFLSPTDVASTGAVVRLLRFSHRTAIFALAPRPPFSSPTCECTGSVQIGRRRPLPPPRLAQAQDPPPSAAASTCAPFLAANATTFLLRPETGPLSDLAPHRRRETSAHAATPLPSPPATRPFFFFFFFFSPRRLRFPRLPGRFCPLPRDAPRRAPLRRTPQPEPEPARPLVPSLNANSCPAQAAFPPRLLPLVAGDRPLPLLSSLCLPHPSADPLSSHLSLGTSRPALLQPRPLSSLFQNSFASPPFPLSASLDLPSPIPCPSTSASFRPPPRPLALARHIHPDPNACLFSTSPSSPIGAAGCRPSPSALPALFRQLLPADHPRGLVSLSPSISLPPIRLTPNRCPFAASSSHSWLARRRRSLLPSRAPAPARGFRSLPSRSPDASG